MINQEKGSFESASFIPLLAEQKKIEGDRKPPPKKTMNEYKTH